MKSHIFYTAFLAIVCSYSPVRADLIYDSFNGLNQTTNSFTTTGSPPRNFMGDDLSTIATPSAGQRWAVDTIGLRVFAGGSGATLVAPVVYENVTMRVRVFDAFNGTAAAGTSVFSNVVSDINWELETLTNNSATGGGQFFTFNLDYVGNGFSFDLATGQGIGVTVELLSNGTANQGLAMLLRSTAGDPGLPLVGTSDNGWYRDANANGIIEASDRRTLGVTNSNMHLQINATAVPEPSSMVLMGLVAVGFMARRKSR